MFASHFEPCRFDWTLAEIESIYNQPFVDLLFKAHTIHRAFHNPHEIQPCRILSIKTGACPEDCKYCPQSAHYKTDITKEPLFSVRDIVSVAQGAKEKGATRFCMGAAWRKVTDGAQFEQVLEAVRQVDALGLEVCTTLGMLTEHQAMRLKEAGCTAYNHNLDTSPEFYGEIITTRTYQDRLDTIGHVRKAGITVCCGGIVGMGETTADRIGLLHQLAILQPHPESVPINLLSRVEGTPLAKVPPPHPFVMVRMIATARILMPTSIVRLSAGRTEMSDEMHALCYFAGANSVFMAQEKIFITPNPKLDRDQELLDLMGLRFAPEPLTKVKRQKSLEAPL